MDPKNFTIGILSTTAVILFVGLTIIHTRPEPAYAAGMTTTNGDYVLTVGIITINDRELVYVIDAPAEKLIAYGFDAGKRQIDVVEGISLADMRGAAAQQPPGQQPPRKPKKP